MGIRAEISKRDATFTETERKIASFFLNCGDELGQMSSAEAARHIGVSQSTVIKFVQKVASCGFVEFKMKLYEERMRLSRQVKSLGGDVTLASPINDVIGAIYQETIASLRQTYENLDQNAVLQAIDLLEHAERIFICGKGASYFPAQDLASKLMKFGLTVICIEDLETMELGALGARPADVYLCFSFSGETKDIVRIISKAKKGGAQCIVVTKSELSTLGRLADIRLEIVTDESKDRAAAMSSRIAFFSIVDVLFLGVLKQDLGNRLEMLTSTH